MAIFSLFHSRLCRFAALNLLLFSTGARAESNNNLRSVTLVQSSDHVTLGNGTVSFEVLKANGNIRELKYGSVPILAEPGYLDWQSNGNNHIEKGAFSVVADPAKNGGEMAEVSVIQSGAGNTRTPFDVELHYVLRRGDSGLYCYTVFNHPKDYPAGGIGQARWVLRLDDSVFDFINVDDQRRRLMPPVNTPAKVLGPKESSQFTEGPFKDFITDKYHFFVDVGDHFVHGWIGTQKRIGCWVVYGSNEAQNGGPTKQTNSAHFGRMLFKIITCGHYGARGVDVAAGEEWRKIYGPWMLYCNSGGDKDALWADAKKQAETQREAWPLAWMNRADFPPAAARGTVRGQLRISDEQDAAASPSNAWVGLAAPSPDWQKQANGYQFWVHAAKDGSFAIPNVRAGEYTLYAFTNGVMDEFRRDGVRVEKGGSLDLGTLEWKPVRFGKQLWQIGTPDRTAKEFKHGEDYRQWGLWLKYPEDFPNGVNFTIGKSKESTDWNYAQVNVQKNGQWVGTKWNILFDFTQPPQPGAATLRLAFASTHNAKLSVFVNDKAVGGFRTAADNAMIRAGIHGQYSEEDIVFDATLLKPGSNTISLEQSAAGNMQKSVMYDCVRLELDNSQPFDKSAGAQRKHTPGPQKEAEPAD
jgi:rhamnogalacturonan endolyase